MPRHKSHVTCTCLRKVVCPGSSPYRPHSVWLVDIPPRLGSGHYKSSPFSSLSPCPNHSRSSTRSRDRSTLSGGRSVASSKPSNAAVVTQQATHRSIQGRIPKNGECLSPLTTLEDGMAQVKAKYIVPAAQKDGATDSHPTQKQEYKTGPGTPSTHATLSTAGITPGG